MALKLGTSADETITLKDSELVDGGDSEATYTIRRLSVPKTREIFEKHRKRAAAKGGDVNAFDVQDDQLDYILVGWTGMEDAGGNALPCERLYKLGDGDLILGLPAERRIALLKESQKIAKVSEDAKQKSFRDVATVR